MPEEEEQLETAEEEQQQEDQAEGYLVLSLVGYDSLLLTGRHRTLKKKLLLQHQHGGRLIGIPSVTIQPPSINRVSIRLTRQMTSTKICTSTKGSKYLG